MTDDQQLVEAMARAMDPGIWSLFDRLPSHMDDWHKTEHRQSIERACRALVAYRTFTQERANDRY
jgi:hypothetical protein